MVANFEKEGILLRIARHLIMRSSFINDLGLYHGKMGIVLFFAHYARYTNELLYDDFASNLLNEILEEIHADTPINFESGLCGIGWGVEYLLQNNFMPGNSDEILSEIDEKIMERNLRRMSDLTIRTGVEGMLYYIDKRLCSNSRQGEYILFDDLYLSDYEYVKAMTRQTIPDEKQILNFILKKQPEGDNIIEWRLGLENGCAGFALKQILI